MYICICNNVNEHAIKAAIAEGATSLSDLSAATGVATSCGKCAGEAMRILQQVDNASRNSSQQRLSVPVLTVVA